MSEPNITEILKQAQQMQGRVAELQRQLALKRFEASSGGGMVTAVVSGGLRVLEIRIEPSLFEGGDREMIQDLTAAAINAAMAEAQRGAQEEMQRLQGSLGINILGAAGGVPGGGTPGPGGGGPGGAVG